MLQLYSLDLSQLYVNESKTWQKQQNKNKSAKRSKIIQHKWYGYSLQMAALYRLYADYNDRSCDITHNHCRQCSVGRIEYDVRYLTDPRSPGGTTCSPTDRLAINVISCEPLNDPLKLRGTARCECDTSLMAGRPMTGRSYPSMFL